MSVTFTTPVLRLNLDLVPGFFMRTKVTIQNGEKDVVLYCKPNSRPVVIKPRRQGQPMYVQKLVIEPVPCAAPPARYESVGANVEVNIPIDAARSFVGPCGHFPFTATFTVLEANLASFLQLNGMDAEASPDCAQCGSPPTPMLPLTYVSEMGAFKNGFLKKDKMTDFEIHVDGDIFHAHKVILAKEGKVFERMVEDDMEEAIEGKVTIVDFDAEQMRLFLEVYYDRATMMECLTDCSKVLDIFHVAEKYEVPDIINRCGYALMRIPLGPEHLCEAICVGSMCAQSVPGLLDRCAHEVKKMPNDFWRQESARALLKNTNVMEDFMCAFFNKP